jgi:hypothetical protein
MTAPPPRWLQDPDDAGLIHSYATRAEDPFWHVITHCGKSIPYETVKSPQRHHTGCHKCFVVREGRA